MMSGLGLELRYSLRPMCCPSPFLAGIGTEHRKFFHTNDANKKKLKGPANLMVAVLPPSLQAPYL